MIVPEKVCQRVLVEPSVKYLVLMDGGVTQEGNNVSPCQIVATWHRNLKFRFIDIDLLTAYKVI